jgi:signal recognition particle receptor subunit beta
MIADYFFIFLSVGAALILIPLLRWLLTGGNRTAGVLPVSKVKRTHCLLVGLPWSGKTKLFYRLTEGKDVKTQTSMVANAGEVATLAGDHLPLVDYPGHRRLRQGLWKHVAVAKVVVLVVDSVTIQDTTDEGGQAAAELLRDLLRSREIQGVEKIIVCCTKRDEVVSYTSKNIQRILGGLLGKLFQSQSGAVSGLGTEGKPGAEADGGNPYIVVNNDVFDFAGSAMEFVFVDCSSIISDGTPDTKKFDVETVRNAIFEGRTA